MTEKDVYLFYNDRVKILYSEIEARNNTLPGELLYVGAGTFTMSGGEISGNTAPNEGGGGVMVAMGTFVMSGGKISDNIASSGRGGGGGVYVKDSGTFTMSGGEISGNTANRSGGGVCGESFSKSGGTITGYASDNVNGNVVKNSLGVVQDNKGHTAFIDNDKHRETTAGPKVNMKSDLYGTVGGWE